MKIFVWSLLGVFMRWSEVTGSRTRHRKQSVDHARIPSRRMRYCHHSGSKMVQVRAAFRALPELDPNKVVKKRLDLVKEVFSLHGLNKVGVDTQVDCSITIELIRLIRDRDQTVGVQWCLGETLNDTQRIRETVEQVDDDRCDRRFFGLAEQLAGLMRRPRPSSSSSLRYSTMKSRASGRLSSTSTFRLFIGVSLIARLYRYRSGQSMKSPTSIQTSGIMGDNCHDSSIFVAPGVLTWCATCQNMRANENDTCTNTSSSPRTFLRPVTRVLCSLYPVEEGTRALSSHTPSI